MKKVNEPRRVFRGKTEFVLDYSTPETLWATKRDRQFYQSMLRAYIKGKQFFHFGFHMDGLNKVRSSYPVMQAFE